MNTTTFKALPSDRMSNKPIPKNLTIERAHVDNAKSRLNEARESGDSSLIENAEREVLLAKYHLAVAGGNQLEIGLARVNLKNAKQAWTRTKVPIIDLERTPVVKARSSISQNVDMCKTPASSRVPNRRWRTSARRTNDWTKAPAFCVVDRPFMKQETSTTQEVFTKTPASTRFIDRQFIQEIPSTQHVFGKTPASSRFIDRRSVTLETPSTQDVFCKTLVASSVFGKGGTDLGENDTPWTASLLQQKAVTRERQNLNQCSKYYDRDCGRRNLVQCCVTNVWGDCKTVVGAHVLPVTTTPAERLKSLNMEGKFNSMSRNLLPLLRTIEKAYYAHRLCFVLAADHDESFVVPVPRYRIQILDSTLQKEFYNGNETFESLARETFALPMLPDGSTGPFTRCLSFHAQVSHGVAVHKGWIKKSEPRPQQYGSPMDCDIIEFSNQFA